MREKPIRAPDGKSGLEFREVLECGSPLPLFPRMLATQSGRGAAVQDAGAVRSPNSA